MKLIRYRYIDGELPPNYIINGGLFYHKIDSIPYVVGLVDDNNPEPALTKNDLFNLTEGYVKNIGFDINSYSLLTEEERMNLIDNFLQELRNRGYEVNI